MFEKLGQHQPLNRQADQLGTCAAVLALLRGRIDAHEPAAERLHGDDTTVTVLAEGKTNGGRLWTYGRYARPFGGPAPPAALFHYARDRPSGPACRRSRSKAGRLGASRSRSSPSP